MPAYMLFIREGAVVDPAALAIYSAANRRHGRAFVERYGLKPLSVYGALEAFEGETPDGIILLEFPSAAAARAWYDSPEYQAALPDRHSGAPYRAILLEGLDLPAPRETAASEPTAPESLPPSQERPTETTIPRTRPDRNRMTDTPPPIPARIPALPRAEWTDDAREVFAFWGEPNAWEEGSKTNVMMAMANHPDLGKAYNVWGRHLLMSNTLSTRWLELIILRVAWLVKSAYEWHNHVGYGLNAGLTLEDVAAIRDFPEGGAWNAEDKAILASVGELIDTGTLADTSWAALDFLDRRQKMDLVFSIGHYVMTSWALSAFGIGIEGGADPIGFDLKTASGKIPGKTYKPGETEDWTDTRGY